MAIEKHTIKILLSCAVVLVATTSHVFAESLEECMKRKAIAAAPSEEKQIFNNRGCSTGKTTISGESRTCDKHLCWLAPPNYVITDVRLSYNSKIGSENWAKGPSYEPNIEAATKVCFDVHAKSPGGVSNYGKIGSTTIDVWATIKRRPAPEEYIVFARECLEEGAN